MASPSPAATPKRKRDKEATLLSTAKFSFDPSKPESGEDGGASPQTKVAHRFRGLALVGGGGVHGDDEDDDDHQVDSLSSPSKRRKSDQAMIESAKLEHLESKGSYRQSPLVGTETHAAVVDSPFQFLSIGDNTPYSPSQSPHRKISGTPPPCTKKHQRLAEGRDEEYEAENGIVDPVRAALTWHEDEITVYDPEDEDDDGTGINGIGFRPTPALAHARAMRRRQQMADYRKREEGEARARRSQRRKGDESLSTRPKKKSPARKVRFIDSDRQSLAVATQ